MPSKETRLRIFAGPNGSGKTTLFEDIKNQFKTGVFINADLIEKDLAEKGFINLSTLGIQSSKNTFDAYSSASTLKKKAEKSGYKIDIEYKENILINIPKDTHSYEASFVATFIRNELIRSGQRFSFETVMSDESKLREIKEANKAGYKTYLYYISTESPIINEQRVAVRVKEVMMFQKIK